MMDNDLVAYPSADLHHPHVHDYVSSEITTSYPLPLDQAHSFGEDTSLDTITGPFSTSVLDEVEPFANVFGCSFGEPSFTSEDTRTPHFDEPSLLLSYDGEGLPSILNSQSEFLASEFPIVYAHDYSPRFPMGYALHPSFARNYQLCDELGSGGYGFVMTAVHQIEQIEVAVKFVIKDKVPKEAWVADEVFGRLPMEVMLLMMVNHDNIVKCLDVYEDELYFYVIQELHGSPWPRRSEERRDHEKAGAGDPGFLSPADLSSPPALSPSSSEISIDSSPTTPYHESAYPEAPSLLVHGIESPTMIQPPRIPLSMKKPLPFLDVSSRPQYCRRPSHDLFECIEQTKHKRLSEKQARYIMSQVVDAVHYLNNQGISHRDIKDENLVVDRDLRVKLIDFGSATIVDPSFPRPYYKLFFGTTAYASPEILQKKPYQAEPAEVWTLGVLMSYLLTGMSPFPSESDALEGRIVLSEVPGKRLSKPCLHMMARCLEPDPARRATIEEVREHRWLWGSESALGHH